MQETLPNNTLDAESGNGLEHPTSATSVPDYTASNMLPPKRRRWGLLLPLLLVAALAAGGLLFLLQPTKSTLSATVRRGTIISTVETTGKLQAAQSAKLAFGAGGRVARLPVEPGDFVEQGTVLAELDTAPLQKGLREAQAQLQISRLNLQKAKEGAAPSDVAAAQANLNGATARLNALKAGARTEDVTAAQSQLNMAQSRFDALKKGASTQEIAGAQARLDGAKANREGVAAAAANATEQARILMVQAAGSTDNFLDPAGRLVQARLNYEAAQKSEAAQLKAADAKIVEAQQALDAIKAGPGAEALREAQEGVVVAQANLDKLKKGATPDELAEAQAGVDAAQAALDKAQAGPTDTDLAILEQGVNLAQIAVDRANAQLTEARITSPIDGTVLTVDIEVGEIVGGQQPVIIVADTGTLRIEADIDEIDIGRVRAGQVVTVTLDAYPGMKMPGKIETLAPGATQKQGSTVYRASISFTPIEGVVPREGMAANVDITAQRKDKVLLLPNRAFETVGRRQYVTVADASGNPAKMEVETGLSNTTDTEVISGLTEGQVVIMK